MDPQPAAQPGTPDGATASCPTIGVFDSGVGGLTVARAILHYLPGARLIYFGDTAHVPYGPRPLPQVRDFALQIIEFLFAQGVDAVAIGCNMSAAAGTRKAALERFDKPVFGIIHPGSVAAHAISPQGNIGVIATQGTINSGIYGRSLRALGVREVHEQACPAFVPLVERGLNEGPEVEEAVATYLAPLRAAEIDTLIFGCTHYPYLATAIGRYLGEGVTLIDPGEYAAREVAAYFGHAGACTPDPNRHRFFCSGDPNSLRREGERLLGFPLLAVEQVNVPVESVIT